VQRHHGAADGRRRRRHARSCSGGHSRALERTGAAGCSGAGRLRAGGRGAQDHAPAAARDECRTRQR
jgi:hypothetical protein